MVKFPKCLESALVTLLRHKGGRGDALDFTRKAWEKIDEDKIVTATRLGKYAVASDPRYSAGWKVLALAYRMAGDGDKARGAYDEGLRHAPSDAGLMVGLGDLERELGRFLDAESWYRKALEQNPVDSEGLWALAQSLRGQHRFPEAEIILRQALEVSGNRAKILRTLGSNMIDQGRYAEAVDSLKKAYSIEKSDPITNYSLAYATDALGDHDGALAFAESALSLDRNNEAYIALRNNILGRANSPK